MNNVTSGMIPNVLAIAGSDPSGGAGIQADLKTFAALGCHGMAAVTALTAQNTRGVSAVHLPPADFVAEQIRMVLDDVDVAAIKIGMLGSAAIVAAVADALASYPVPIVLDPVLVATSGATLGDDGVIAAMRARLFPLACVITPNLAETCRLAGILEPTSAADVEAAAGKLHDGPAACLIKGGHPAAWLIKGGHATGAEAADYLWDGARGWWFTSPRIATTNTHGTGCTLSSAIAAQLAHGHVLEEAVRRAKAYLDGALAGADRLTVGRGHGPVDHFARWRAGDV